jgi:hypothetical protein
MASPPDCATVGDPPIRRLPRGDARQPLTPERARYSRARQCSLRSARVSVIAGQPQGMSHLAAGVAAPMQSNPAPEPPRLASQETLRQIEERRGGAPPFGGIHPRASRVSAYRPGPVRCAEPVPPSRPRQQSRRCSRDISCHTSRVLVLAASRDSRGSTYRSRNRETGCATFFGS